MIKDSKIIGTKIAAPYGWKKFKVGELFDVKSTRALNFDDLESSGDYPYVVRSAERNGIRDYMTGPVDFLNKGNCITLGVDTSSYFYQACDYFFAGANLKALYLKSYNLNMNIALYLISVLSKQVSGYGYTGGKSFSVQEFSSECLDLPVLPNSQPDFAWMENYIKLVQEDYVQQKKLSNQAEIKVYLTESQTDSLEITADDRKFLHEFDKLPRREFKLGELFDHIVQGKRLKRSDHISGNVPFIMAGTTNTGISDYISNSVKHFPSNSITIDIFGNAFYRDYEYGMGDDTGAYWSESSCISKFTMLFIVTLLNKSLMGIYGYGHKLRSSRAADLSIILPISAASQVDVHSIEKYMQIQSKPLINKVAETLAPVGGGF